MNGDWFPAFFDGWTKFWYSGRSWFVWGCWPFLLIVGLWLLFKLLIWATGIALAATIAILMYLIGFIASLFARNA